MRKNKTAYLVLGPESSGTKLVTKILMCAGCFGDDGHRQRLDKAIPDRPCIVWRRSLPYHEKWPDIEQMLAKLAHHQYKARAIVTSRDWHAMIRGQATKHNRGDVERSITNSRFAYRIIFRSLSNTPFEVVNYEAIVARPQEYVSNLLTRLDLPTDIELPHIYDGNLKYYGDS